MAELPDIIAKLLSSMHSRYEAGKVGHVLRNYVLGAKSRRGRKLLQKEFIICSRYVTSDRDIRLGSQNLLHIVRFTANSRLIKGALMSLILTFSGST